MGDKRSRYNESRLYSDAQISLFHTFKVFGCISIILCCQYTYEVSVYVLLVFGYGKMPCIERFSPRPTKRSKILTIKVILYQPFNGSFSISPVLIAQESHARAKPCFLMTMTVDQKYGLVTVKTSLC